MPEGPARVRASGSTRDAVREFYAAEARNAERIQKYTLGLTDDDDLPPYVPEDHPYPKALYDLDGEAIVVADAHEEREKLGEGYYATLAQAKEAWLDQQQERAERAVALEDGEEPALLAKPKRSHKKKPAA